MDFASPFPADVAFAVVPWGAHGIDALHPVERADVSERAVDKRVAEFVAGRMAARAALTIVGFASPPPVVRGDDRAPQWPAGYVGTITHTGGWALAAVAPIERCGGLGLDLEQLDSRRPLGIARYIADADEQAWIAGDLAALLTVFSAKEAVYKALYPRVRRYFGFGAVSFAAPVDGRLRGVLREDLGVGYPAGTVLEVGTQRYPGDLVLSALWLPPDRAAPDQG